MAFTHEKKKKVEKQIFVKAFALKQKSFYEEKNSLRKII